MGHEPRFTKLLAWCLLIATTGSFASSIYAQWLEGETFEMRQLVSRPMPNWNLVFVGDDADDNACADTPHVAAAAATKAPPAAAPSQAAEPASVAADARDAY